MTTITLQCPACGSKVKADDRKSSASCEYCGTQVLIPGRETVQPVNDNFEAQLSQVQLHADAYFIRPNAKKFNAVLQKFNQLELSGGAIRSEFWGTKARFYAKAVIEGSPLVFHPNVAPKVYTFYIDSAIKRAQPNERASLEIEKDQALFSLQERIKKYKFAASGPTTVKEWISLLLRFCTYLALIGIGLIIFFQVLNYFLSKN
jgi:DNA-directed RNA polymerase subunit RPC12/RpoP